MVPAVDPGAGHSAGWAANDFRSAKADGATPGDAQPRGPRGALGHVDLRKKAASDGCWFMNPTTWLLTSGVYTY